MAGFPGDLPLMTPTRDQISDGLDALGRARVLDAAVLAALRARHADVLAVGRLRVAAGDAPAGAPGHTMVLHGDAHAGNLLRSGAGWLWIDLEETCLGSREWDLAVLARSDGGGQAAVDAYASAARIPPPRTADLAPFTRARELEGAVWSLGMAHQYPERYRAPAAALLASVLARHRPAPA